MCKSGARVLTRDAYLGRTEASMSAPARMVDLVAQVDLFSAAPYEVSRPKNPLTVPTY